MVTLIAISMRKVAEPIFAMLTTLRRVRYAEVRLIFSL